MCSTIRNWPSDLPTSEFKSSLFPNPIASDFLYSCQCLSNSSLLKESQHPGKRIHSFRTIKHKMLLISLANQPLVEMFGLSYRKYFRVFSHTTLYTFIHPTPTEKSNRFFI